MRNAVYSLLVLTWAVSVSVPGSENAGHSTVEQTCSATNLGAADVTFTWPAAPGAREVWLDLSLYSVGFDAGAFADAGPFDATTTSYTWSGLQPSTLYYYRVNALYDGGWHSLKVGSFVSGQCGQPAEAVQLMSQQCSSDFPGMVSVTFSWSPALLPGGPQFLDLSLYNTGFADATFVGKGPLPPSQSSVTWDALIPSSTYYWRVNTQGYDGWHDSPTWSFGTLACGTTGQFGVQPNADLLQLRDRLSKAIADSGFNVAVAAIDLQTGESVAVKGDDPRQAGCTVNWFVLLSNVLDLQNGSFPESNVGDLIARTIWGSNPFTAHELLLKTGGGSVQNGVFKVNELLARMGLHNTIFDHPPGYEGDYLEYSLRGSANLITANDAIQALAQFYDGSVVNLRWRDYLMEKMVNVKPGLQYLIPAGVGDATVSHKNGFSWVQSGWIDNDIGIVTFDTSSGEHAYAIVIYIEDIPTEYADIPIGQTVSRLIWEYFSAHYH